MRQYGILLVSHVPDLPNAVLQLLQQVAADVPITLAGGTDDQTIGTSVEKVITAINANAAKELLVFYDLGSAKMNVEMASELVDKPLHLFDTAFVESAYAAAAMLQVDVSLNLVQQELEKLVIK